jgi:hypothetical protein
MQSSTPVATTLPQSSYPAIQSSNQCSSTNAASQMSSFGFLLFLLIGSFCFGRWLQKRHKKQSIDCHQQQVERLERIWKMMTHPEL